MNGFVIGKFYPPHLGHSHLIREALAKVEHLVVVVCGEAGQAPTLEQRAAWLQEIFPQIEVRMLDTASFDSTSELAWTNATQLVLGEVPELMISSENYGEHYSQLLGCKHTHVDLDRTVVPIAASDIRKNPAKYLHFLEAPVRSYYEQFLLN